MVKELFKDEVESLMRILVRCKKIYDAKAEIMRILLKAKKRENLVR